MCILKLNKMQTIACVIDSLNITTIITSKQTISALLLTPRGGFVAMSACTVIVIPIKPSKAFLKDNIMIDVCYLTKIVNLNLFCGIKNLNLFEKNKHVNCSHIL